MAATGTKKAFCLPKYSRIQPIVDMQQSFRTKFGKDLPLRNNIKQWKGNSSVAGAFASQNAQDDSSEDQP
jgi:hypothetical protein